MSVWRRITIGAGGVLALCLLLLGVVLAIPATETGSRWLVQQLPGVQVEGFKGRLLGDGATHVASATTGMGVAAAQTRARRSGG